MRILLYLMIASTILIAACSKPAMLPPSAVAVPFDELSTAAKNLRAFVTDAFPAGTTLVHYEHSEAWDGTIADYWFLNSPSGFSELNRPSKNREVVSSQPDDTIYEVLATHLNQINVKLDGTRSQSVWNLYWRSTLSNTTVRGDICPYADGEILYIQRVTLR